MMSVETCFAQALPPVRGQYTPGVSAINSGVMPEGGLTYANYFLDYSFDKFVTARGDTVFEKGEAATFKDVNVFEWVFAKKFLGADFAVVAGVRFSSSSLTSARLGALSGGGFADFSLQPASLGWHFKRADFQVAYVFFAPTGRFVAGASDNIGSGFWTNSPTAGETLYLTRNKRTAFSAYQMYEFHTAQEGSNIHPGETMDLDYSLTQVLPLRKNGLLQFGVVGYGQWQTTNNGGPGVNPRDPGHYRVNAIGGTVSIALPVRKKTALGFSLFQGVLKLINRPGIFASDYGRYHVLAPPGYAGRSPARLDLSHGLLVLTGERSLTPELASPGNVGWHFQRAGVRLMPRVPASTSWSHRRHRRAGFRSPASCFDAKQTMSGAHRLTLCRRRWSSAVSRQLWSRILFCTAPAWLYAGMTGRAAGRVLQGSNPTSVFSPASTPADSIYHLSLLVVVICAAIFLTVFSLLVYSVVKYRRREDDDGREPPQIYGSNQVELAWTVIPVLTVVVLFLATARVIHGLEDARLPAGTTEVTAVGHQFWWEFQYPQHGFITANELHVPVSDPQHPTPTRITLLSADTDHSFWVPRLAGKTDLIPNRINHMWIEPHETGVYVGQCAQYCGTQHAKMLLRVIVESRADFDRWVSEQQQPARADKIATGQQIFETTACVNCHTIAGTNAHGTFGPDLTHLMSRETIGAGAALNSPENLRQWVQNPGYFKPGALMPAMQLDGHDLDAVTDYLLTLK